jgi:hypothetical protein
MWAALIASAAGSMLAGAQAREAYDYQAKAAEQNAALATQSANIEADQVGEKHRRTLARQRAMVGSSGYATEGTPLAVMMDSAEQAARDVALIRYSGEVAGTGYEGEAKLRQLEGRSALMGGYMHAGTTLLSGAVDRETRNQRRRSGGFLER